MNEAASLPAVEIGRIVGVFGAASLVVAACAPSSSVPETGVDAFVAYLDGAVPAALAEHQVPGAAIAIVEDGRVAWSGAYGVRGSTTEAVLQPDDAFQVASLSKPLAAYTIMALAEQGTIDLDTPVERYLERWELPDSGLPPLEASLEGASGGAPVRLIDAPGTGFRYSGGGYGSAQLAVEDATGEPFDELAARLVLDPLGMTDSTFAEEAPADAATPHDADGQPLPWFRHPELAAAGLVSTAPDLARAWPGAISMRYPPPRPRSHAWTSSSAQQMPPTAATASASSSTGTATS